MAKDSAAKWISRNRAPRVQIQYDCEVLSEKKREIPFVMGVMADLSGDSKKDPLKKRNFTEVDVDNFDDYMKSLNPTLEFGKDEKLDNTITGEGFLETSLSFSKMDDFSPASIAEQVPAIKKLLDARNQLNQLAAATDGKDEAENLITELLARETDEQGNVTGGFQNEDLLKKLMEDAHSSE